MTADKHMFDNTALRNIYLDLIKKTLTDTLRKSDYYVKYTGPKGSRLALIDNFIRKKYGLHLAEFAAYDEDKRLNGKDWPPYAETMVGIKRLNNIEYLICEIIKSGIPGDLIETGVWRGGATIFMRAVLKAYNITDKVVWVADSFKGLPKPDPEKYSADRDDTHHTKSELSISIEEVKQNFMNYDLLDDQVQFLQGWFKDTLPAAPIKQLSLIRLDGDMYESTMDGLVHLYPKLAAGGYIIIDDWGAVPACKKAVVDFREQNQINDEIVVIDWGGVFWQKSK
jgi:hypothetical protein